MIQWKKDNLPTRQEKEAAAKKQAERCPQTALGRTEGIAA